MSIDRRLVSIGVLAVVIIAFSWWEYGRSPETGVPATFERIRDAIATKDASGVISELHDRYNFMTLWSKHYDAMDAAGRTDANVDARANARRGLAMLFFSRRDHPMRFAFTLSHLIAHSDGTVEVDAAIEVSSEGGGGQLVSPLKTHHFVLARNGWFIGKYRILSHDPIDVETGF